MGLEQHHEGEQRTEFLSFGRTIPLNWYANLRRTHKWFCCTHFLFLQGEGHNSLHTLRECQPFREQHSKEN